MAEDKFADEILSDEELDNVAGGNIGNTTADNKIYARTGSRLCESKLQEDTQH